MATNGLTGLSMSTCSTAASSAARASLRYTSAGSSCDFSQRTTAASVGVEKLSGVDISTARSQLSFPKVSISSTEMLVLEVKVSSSLKQSYFGLGDGV